VPAPLRCAKNGHPIIMTFTRRCLIRASLLLSLLSSCGILVGQSEMPSTKVMCRFEQARRPREHRPAPGDAQSKLLHSIRTCDYQTTAGLVASGMGLNFVRENTTPLFLAIYFGENDVVEDLLNHGADPNQIIGDEPDSSALTSAALSSNARAAELLLHAGAAPDHQDSFGNTALMYAAEEGNIRVFRQLLQHGANPNIKNKFGLTARDHAARAKHPDVAALL
jgi:Ankyrin repeats (many copies)/Ankyrin repeat